MEQKHKLNPTIWVDDYSDNMFRFAVSRVSKVDVAEDLVQETFLSALKAKDRFKGDSTEKTWLYSILKRKIIDYYRKASTKHELNFSQMTPFNDDGDWLGRWKDERSPNEWDNSNDDQFDVEEFSKVLKDCVKELPEKYAEVFELKTMRGVESEDICNDLGISSSNLWVILHRSRVQLRECLEINWFVKK
ncbi:MAG: sigma-70 family RNA polymerase sigma factor [Flavobacteriales bacterium]|nr:sigma-70 family RNA polymerase sigma factor [Flavobacteriales bacterium]